MARVSPPSAPPTPPPQRRKLTGAYCESSRWYRSPLTEDRELALLTNEPRALLVHTALLAPKTTRGTQGVQVMNIKPKYHLERLADVADTGITNQARYRTRTIPPPAPAAGRRTARKSSWSFCKTPERRISHEEKERCRCCWRCCCA